MVVLYLLRMELMLLVAISLGKQLAQQLTKEGIDIVLTILMTLQGQVLVALVRLL